MGSYRISLKAAMYNDPRQQLLANVEAGVRARLKTRSA